MASAYPGSKRMKDFIALVVDRRGITFITDSMSREAREARAVLVRTTKNIDFGCNFKKGKCNRQRKKEELAIRVSSTSKMGKPQCCCEGCASNIGYFYNIPSDWIVAIAQCWRPKTGFFGAKGCRLPREYRSSTCLSHYCYCSDNSKMNETDKAVLRAIEILRI